MHLWGKYPANYINEQSSNVISSFRSLISKLLKDGDVNNDNNDFIKEVYDDFGSQWPDSTSKLTCFCVWISSTKSKVALQLVTFKVTNEKIQLFWNYVS